MPKMQLDVEMEPEKHVLAEKIGAEQLTPDGVDTLGTRLEWRAPPKMAHSDVAEELQTPTLQLDSVRNGERRI